MVPKKRKKDKHLPERVYQKHNAFFYVDKKSGKWIRLGLTFTEAMANWAKLVEQNRNIITMNELFTRYLQEVAVKKADASYKKNLYQIQKLREVFGDMLPHEIKPTDIYKFLDLRGQKAPVTANREKSLLSHVFSYAIRWGLILNNPCRDVKRLTERPRDRYIEDWEYHEVRQYCPTHLQLLMDFGYLSGQRISDILKIKLSDLSDQGIYIQQNKTNKKIIIEWSDELRCCVDKIKKLPRSIIHSITLFCNMKGQPLVYDAFSTLWLKAIKKALLAGRLRERFSFHDIRAKAASDSQNRIAASQLLGHTDQRITDRVYIRSAQKVKPMR